MTTRISDMDRHVARRVRQLRVLAGLSMQELAARIGTSYQMLYKYETGKNRISAGRLHAIAQALGVEVAAFFPAVEPQGIPCPDCFGEGEYKQCDDDGRWGIRPCPRCNAESMKAEFLDLCEMMPEEHQKLMAKLTRAMVP